MSWLARSIADSLRLDGADGGDIHGETSGDGERNQIPPSSWSSSSSVDHHHNLKRDEQEEVIERDGGDSEGEDDPSRGVKEDLSELKQTLTRQLWGVASFLAPPPDPDSHNQSQSPPHDPSGENGENSTDFPESRISNYYLYEEEEEDEYNEQEEEEMVRNAAGITEEVMIFATNIAMHPETWLDFPIAEEDDVDDFYMSAAQEEHAFAVEHLAPRLAALRFELCPAHMSEGYFWKVYFVLLHSRLNRHDAELLSTPQVVAARSLWMKELQRQTKEEEDWSAICTPRFKERANSLEDEFFVNLYHEPHPGRFTYEISSYEPATSDVEIVKHPIISTERHISDKSVVEDKPMIETNGKAIESGPSTKFLDLDLEDDEDDWLKEGNVDFEGHGKPPNHYEDEEDISFSDLEDDEDC